MVEEQLIPHDIFPYSVTLAIALLLWGLGLLAIVAWCRGYVVRLNDRLRDALAVLDGGRRGA